MRLSWPAADTSLEAAWMQVLIHRRLSPEQRWDMICDMNDALRARLRAGLRARHADFDPEQLRLAEIRLWLGEEIFAATHPRGKASMEMNQQNFVRLLADSLDAEQIPFMLCGSFASSFHGQARTTNDVDLVIDPAPARLESWIQRIARDCYVSPQAALAALAQRSMFNVIELSTGWKADLIVRKDRPFSVEEFQRRLTGDIHGQTLPIATAEDVILTKLEWNQITPSEKHLKDVQNVIVEQGERLNLDYLRKWASQLGVGEQLEEALQAVKRI